jgi:hypothetical protein
MSVIPHIAIISSGRPGRVQEMRTHLGKLAELAFWYVGADESADYAYAGAPTVIESGGLCESRNAALESAFATDKICVQLSDDLTGVDWCFDHKNKNRITLERAVLMVAQSLGKGARLAGAGATDNAFFIPADDISEHVFIIGDLMAVAPNPLRFDENLRLKEDLEYSIQHIKEYGKVARLNTILANWQHRTNLGGAVQYRTAAGEQEACDYIAAKHPGWTRKNVKRDNPEILLVYPPATIQETVSPLRAEA